VTGAVATPAAAQQTASSSSALDVVDVVAGYGKSIVVDRVSLSVRAGEVILLLGRNGVGKTTTLRCIAGVHPAMSGTVRLGDRDITRRAAYQRVRAGIALVPSGARAFAPLSVEHNLRLVTGRTPSDDRWSVERVFELFPPLQRLRNAAAGQLSGGERQMLAVGRALMANPAVILLDEPSEGLAPVMVQSIATLLGQLRSTGIGVLLAEQNHHMALRVADTFHFMEKGRIAASSDPATARSGDLVKRFLGV
jgi:branched-chain amino acid transport system ATP-binding protein